MVAACSCSARSHSQGDKILPYWPTPLARPNARMRFPPQLGSPSLGWQSVVALPNHAPDAVGFLLSSPIPLVEPICLMRFPNVVTLTQPFVERSEFKSPQTGAEMPGSSKHPEKHRIMRRE